MITTDMYRKQQQIDIGRSLGEMIDADIIESIKTLAILDVIEKLNPYLLGKGYIKMGKWIQDAQMISDYIAKLYPSYSTLNCDEASTIKSLVSELDLSNGGVMIETEYYNQLYVHKSQCDKVRLMMKFSDIGDTQ
tara:strand:+ start:101 stop:505 length:405 start_codon:yes stop_codon:yes gene_type:complete